MVETEISNKYQNELWQKQKYHRNTKSNYGRNRNIIEIQNRIMVETEISYKYNKRIMVEAEISYNTKNRIKVETEITYNT